MRLAETGTPGLLRVAVGSAADGMSLTWRRLLPLFGPGMLVLLDRAFDANAFLPRSPLQGRCWPRAKSTRNPRVAGILPHGSYLSCLDGLNVRIIEADVAMTGADDSRIGGNQGRAGCRWIPARGACPDLKSRGPQ